MSADTVLPRHTALLQRMVAAHGLERLCYLAFQAGKHGDCSFDVWLDNAAIAEYRRERKITGQRAAKAAAKDAAATAAASSTPVEGS